MEDFLLVALMFFIGIVVGSWVTEKLHKSHEVWNNRIHHSRWRYANIPVGGIVMGTIAIIYMSPYLAGMALGMAISAIVWRFIDPLPMISSREYK